MVDRLRGESLIPSPSVDISTRNKAITDFSFPRLIDSFHFRDPVFYGFVFVFHSFLSSSSPSRTTVDCARPIGLENNNKSISARSHEPAKYWLSLEKILSASAYVTRGQPPSVRFAYDWRLMSTCVSLLLHFHPNDQRQSQFGLFVYTIKRKKQRNVRPVILATHLSTSARGFSFYLIRNSYVMPAYKRHKCARNSRTRPQS